MADKRPRGPRRGRLEVLEKGTCLMPRGPKPWESQEVGLCMASGDSACSGCWCWQRLFWRGATPAPRPKKAQYVQPGEAAPKRGPRGAPSLRGLLQRVAAWRRRPASLEEIPLLAQVPV